MEEIDLRELLEHFKKNLLKLTLITLGICLLGCIYALLLQKPEYTSSTTLVLTGVNGNENNSSTITTNDLTINSKLVKTYREIAKSRKVLEQVIDTLKLDMTVESLAKEIRISSVEETEIIRISVIQGDPDQAKEIADTLATVFSKEIAEIYNVKNISILDKANFPETASNINIPKQVILYLAIGLLVSCVVIFLTFYFDTTIKSAEQVEQKIGLPILGNVPSYNRKKRGNRR